MNSTFPKYTLSPKKIIEYLNYYQLQPRKKLGQNFLLDQNVAAIIVKALSLKKEEIIFEVGTGLGSLTSALILHTKHIFSIEKDLRFKPILDDIFSHTQKNVTILYQDILTFDLAGFLQQKKQEGCQIEKLTGNLPYSISLPLLRKLMEMHNHLKIAVVMVQKEVAERLMAQPGDKNYGLLSIMAKYYSRIERIHLVKPDVFYPKPEVDSMIIRINFLQKPFVLVEDESLFFELVRSVFQQRRKNIANSLKIYFKERLEKEKLEGILRKMGFNPNRRGEDFSVLEFAQLTSEIKKIIN